MKKIETMLKEQGKNEIFIGLVKKMLKDNNINEEKSITILEKIYK